MLPDFRGKQRLARLILKKKLNTAVDIVISGQGNCSFKIPNAKESVGFEIFINGSYEQNTVNFISSRLKSSEIFLDIGANIGAITIPVCKNRIDIKAIAIEAAPWLFSYLEENVQKNELSNVTLINKAISDKGQMKVEFYSPREKFGKGSMAPVFTEDGIMVDTITLDEISKSMTENEIGMIKIDVEGFEYRAFQGGKELLQKQDAPDILFEFVDWAEERSGIEPGAAQRLLIEYGYKIFFFECNRISGKMVEPVKNGTHMFFATKSLSSIPLPIRLSTS